MLKTVKIPIEHFSSEKCKIIVNIFKPSMNFSIQNCLVVDFIQKQSDETSKSYLRIDRISKSIVFHLLIILIIAAKSCVGIKLSQANISHIFTLGELDLLDQNDSQSNLLEIGFTAPNPLTMVGIHDTDTMLLDVNLIPILTSYLVNNRINDSAIDQVVVSIKEKQEIEVYSVLFAGKSNFIGITTLANSIGTYIYA